ncbi:MAG: DUF3011 domain-containing protein [Proteobacteria bacterium]|nr:DUF3011 domain-containing protein [Pseudomonadota bacterium]
MLRLLSVLLLLALAGCAPIPMSDSPYPGAYPQSYPQAYPQPYPQAYPSGYPQVYPAPVPGRAGVRCESHDGAYRECGVGFGGRAELVENLSDTRCVEGRTWGSTGRGSVWVRDGCRGVFAESYRGGGRVGGDVRGGVRCESDSGRLRECAVPGRGRIELVRQLSDTRCIEGRTWGQRGDRVWVDDGCRGEFVASGSGSGGGAWSGGPGGRAVVTCASDNQRTTTCPWDARQGRPQLLEQLSGAECREGQSWGLTGSGEIWVSRGCRGRFGVR